jgi:hypothetical protein
LFIYAVGQGARLDRIVERASFRAMKTHRDIRPIRAN